MENLYGKIPADTSWGTFYKAFDIFPKNKQTKKAIMCSLNHLTQVTLLKELLSNPISILPLAPLYTALGLERFENKYGVVGP